MIRYDILGFGAVAVDDLLYLDAFPEPGSKGLVREERREGGGLAGTALVAAARLGAAAAYAGVLGDDELSRFSLAELERADVDCSLVLRRPDARPFHSVILVDRSTGGRTILSSQAGVVPPPPGLASPEIIAACRVLFVDHTVAAFALAAVPLARRLGIPVVADLERVTPEVLALLPLVDHLVVGERFAAQVTGEAEPAAMARSLLIPGRAAVVVTAGERGCWYAGPEGDVRHQPALRVAVVDTTGCGDVFHGAYATMLARGAPLARAVAVAAVAAGLKATQPGGRSGIPDWGTVERQVQDLLEGTCSSQSCQLCGYRQ